MMTVGIRHKATEILDSARDKFAQYSIRDEKLREVQMPPRRCCADPADDEEILRMLFYSTTRLSDGKLTPKSLVFFNAIQMLCLRVFETESGPIPEDRLRALTYIDLYEVHREEHRPTSRSMDEYLTDAIMKFKRMHLVASYSLICPELLRSTKDAEDVTHVVNPNDDVQLSREYWMHIAEALREEACYANEYQRPWTSIFRTSPLEKKLRRICCGLEIHYQNFRDSIDHFTKETGRFCTDVQMSIRYRDLQYSGIRLWRDRWCVRNLGFSEDEAGAVILCLRTLKEMFFRRIGRTKSYVVENKYAKECRGVREEAIHRRLLATNGTNGDPFWFLERPRRSVDGLADSDD